MELEIGYQEMLRLARVVVANGVQPDNTHFNEILLNAAAHLVEAKYIGTHAGNFRRELYADTSHIAGVRDYHATRRARTARMNQYLTAAKDTLRRELRKVTGRFSYGQLPGAVDTVAKSRFFKDAKSLLKSAYVGAFLAGLQTGSQYKNADEVLAHLSDEDARWIRSAYNHEMRYFTSFLEDIVAGISNTERYRRIDAYVDVLSSIFDGARVATLPSDIIIDWVLESPAPCKGCLELRRLSPFTKDTLPTTPKAGATPCLHNCYCKLKIRHASPEEVKKVADRNGSVDAILQRLAKIKRGKGRL